MTLPRTVADVLSHHVSFEIEAIDRMYRNVYQPRLQHTGGAAGFFVGHRGFTYASSALMAQMTEVFVADLHHFMAVHDVPLVHFAKGQRKDDVAHEYLQGHDGAAVGIADSAHAYRWRYASPRSSRRAGQAFP